MGGFHRRSVTARLCFRIALFDCRHLRGILHTRVLNGLVVVRAERRIRPAGGRAAARAAPARAAGAGSAAVSERLATLADRGRAVAVLLPRRAITARHGRTGGRRTHKILAFVRADRVRAPLPVPDRHPGRPGGQRRRLPDRRLAGQKFGARCV